jgi:hypothetical protein
MTLTLERLRAYALARRTGKQGRQPIIPNKIPSIIHLTPETKDRLRTLAANATASQSDFLEILIWRYGLQAGTDILDALGEHDEPTTRDQPADARDPMPGR